MKKRLRRLIVFASALGLMMALNAGEAFAHDGPAFGETVGEAPSPIPVGSHLLPPMGDHVEGEAPPGHPGAHNGFGFVDDDMTDPDNPAVMAIANNPNCPLHY